MVQGDKIAGCEKCYLQEAIGKRSLRQEANDTFGRPTDHQLKSLELALGNLCNNACIMCNSAFSTKWISDEIALGMLPVKHQMSNVREQTADIVLSDVEHLKLIGGETLLYQDRLVELISNMPSLVSVHISTNATIEVEPDLAAVLRKIPHLNFYISIDAFGPKNEYIRYGSDWKQTTEMVLSYIDKFTLEKIRVGSVVQIANAAYLHELEEWLDEISIRKWTVDTLVQPSCYDIRFHTVEAKNYIQQSLAKLRKEKIKETILAFMWSKQPSDTGFWNHTDRIDSLRNQKFADVFPEIAQYIR